MSRLLGRMTWKIIHRGITLQLSIRVMLMMMMMFVRMKMTMIVIRMTVMMT